MENSIATSLSRIAKGSETLNAHADVLTKQVVQLSKHLQDLQVGVSYFKTDDAYRSSSSADDQEPALCSHSLGYGKDDNGKWGIVVLCKTVWSDEEQSRKLWVRAFEACPRDVRIALAGHAPSLLHGLAEAVRNAVSSMEVSMQSLQEMQQELPEALPQSTKK